MALPIEHDAALVTSQRVPANVRTYMAWRGFRPTQVREHLKLSKATYSERMSGKTPFKDYELFTLAELFELDSPGPFFLDSAELLATHGFPESAGLTPVPTAGRATSPPRTPLVRALRGGRA